MHGLWLLISIIIVLSVSISSNTLIINSINITETRNNNNNNYNFTSLCRNSLVACLDDITYLDKNRKNIKIQTDLILDQVNSTKLKEWIDILSSFHTRNTKSNYIENVAYWLKNELQNLCEGRVSFHNYTQYDQNQTFNLKNIICSKQGLVSSPPPPPPPHHYNNTIIIGAHYDNRAKNINNTDARAPGADDNASGVSALLELVRILSHLNLKYNLEFVLFSGEEHGRWGSMNYVKYLDDNNRTKTVDLYLNLDMIGYRPSNETKNKVILEYDVGNKYVQNDKYSKNIALFIKQIASNYTNLEAELAKLENSDFLSFEAFNHTVIGIHDGGVKKNPHYHKSSDTPDTLNIKYLTSITKMILATILELDKISQYLK
ncbi:MAG TPA: M20/M25/M40 family metallo-hydrolase [Nitrososphaeraceae archaeon]|nr:M20/M25/M40 family metallo-hydrolase [Nitrososphaeraceae archaeon]